MKILLSPGLDSQSDIFEDCNVPHNIGDLKRAAQAQTGYPVNGKSRNFTVSEKDAAAGGFQQACQQIEERGFACAVWTDDRMNGSLFDGEINIKDGCQGAELLG